MDAKGRVAPLRLEIRDLDIAFADPAGVTFSILQVPHLTLESGAELVVTGPSGSGKSSFLYAVTGLLRPARGEIVWQDQNILTLAESARDAWRRTNLGFVFQDFHLINELSPLDNVLIAAWFAHWRAPANLIARARDLLDATGVPAARRDVGTLSRGEQQRVAIARALLFDPPVLIADEPTASLDKDSGERIADLLFDFSRDRTLIAVSHDAALIERFERGIEIVHGQILNTRSEKAVA